MAADREGYPVFRMAFQMVFLALLGTIFSFSTWSERFVGTPAQPGPFPNWTHRELGLVYSMGILGCYATPVGGFLYDALGATPTYLVGLLLALLGVGGMIATMHLDLVADEYTACAMGFFYYLEEQGASTLYMGIAMDTLLHFPVRNLTTSMGLVALGYSMSSIIMGLVLSQVTVGVLPLFTCLAAAMCAFTLARVLCLGDVGSHKYHKVDEQDGGGSYAEALSSPPFWRMLLLSAACLAPCTALLGFVKEAGDAAGLHGAVLAEVVFITNGLGRLVVGYAYDGLRHIPSEQALRYALFGSTAGFALMLLRCLGLHGNVLLWAGCALTAFCFGGCAPLVPAFVRDHFRGSISGGVLSLHHLTVAVSNFVFIWIAGPTRVDESRGFVVPFAAGAGLSALALGATAGGLAAAAAGAGQK